MLIEKIRTAVFGNSMKKTKETMQRKMTTQRLVLPMIDSRHVTGYKNSEYRKYWGFVHYGWDFNSAESDPGVYAQGEGEVVACGKDKLFGNCVVIIYKGCELQNDTVADLTIRYYHLLDKSILVKPGSHVVKGQRIATMGNTGKYTSGPHLHITIDTDTNYPCYEPGLAASGNIIKRGTDTTINPNKVLWIGTGQRIRNGAYSGWNSFADWNLPNAEEDV